MNIAPIGINFNNQNYKMKNQTAFKASFLAPHDTGRIMYSLTEAQKAALKGIKQEVEEKSKDIIGKIRTSDTAVMFDPGLVLENVGGKGAPDQKRIQEEIKLIEIIREAYKNHCSDKVKVQFEHLNRAIATLKSIASGELHYKEEFNDYNIKLPADKRNAEVLRYNDEPNKVMLLRRRDPNAMYSEGFCETGIYFTR